jgi:selenide,water dikinase
VAEHVLATRPIQSFVQRLDAQLDGAGAAPHLVVVGGGVAGTEIAFTLEARLRGAGRAPRVLLVSESDRLLPGLSARLVRRVESEAAARGIVIRTGLRVTEVRSGALRLTGADSEECLACDLVVWATGAAPVAFGSGLPLPKDAAGFVRVRRTLQVEGDDDLFAVGDCASLAGHPTLPKAGVFAVRQGPVLAENLRRRIAGRPLRAYQPQRDYLVLINLGGRRALGTKWGGVVSGRWVWHWKDRIDRRFIAQFR